MEEFFLKRFKKKTKAELEQILAKQEKYEPAAISAATTVLQEELYQLETPTFADPRARTLTKSWNDFRRTFSVRDILPTLLLGAAFITIFFIYDRVGLFNLVPKGFWRLTITTVTLSSFLIANHHLYFLIHGRANSFVGKVILDYTFYIGLIVFFMIIILFVAITHGQSVSASLQMPPIFALVIFLSILVFILFELIVKVLNFMFKLKFL
ncbi:hypothetical protein [Fulvivirga ligni]|uniref:hypothetical protein n=1 Tax=Fulvivirga ligni TaxID=2904246 RepID=UPI001F22D4BD|nr:hypothetical protein [Fulvivirga ligni]UII22239.1 hypothetical protein LVD16_03215 [Fulvivirga ligni]